MYFCFYSFSLYFFSNKTGILGAIAFGNRVSDNILDDFGYGHLAASAHVLGLASIVLSYSITIAFCTRSILDTINNSRLCVLFFSFLVISCNKKNLKCNIHKKIICIHFTHKFFFFFFLLLFFFSIQEAVPCVIVCFTPSAISIFSHCFQFIVHTHKTE